MEFGGEGLIEPCNASAIHTLVDMHQRYKTLVELGDP